MQYNVYQRKTLLQITDQC